MDWVLDHLQLIFIIAGTVAWWFNQRTREKAGERADYDDDGTPEAPARGEFADPDLAERTRRIREEIQRKIEERRRAGGGYSEVPPARSPQSSPAPAAVPPLVADPPQPQRAVSAGIQESRRVAEILQQQADLAASLVQTREFKEAAQRRAAFEAKLGAERVKAKLRREVLVDELRQPEALRRAVILREVLGPPLAMRR